MKRARNWFGCGLVWIAGCAPQGISGGTTGQIRTESSPLADVQITVYRVEGTDIHEAGFGISNPDGEFSLVRTGAAGPLWLEPGEYRFTLESVGPVFMKWSPEYATAARSPLQQQWGPADHNLDLVVPVPR